jgi:hypothetical protein
VTQALTGRVIVGLLWLTILIVVAGAWSAGAARPRAGSFAPPGTRTAPMPDGAMSSDAFDAGSASEPRVDLYGNDIDDALGDYRIDIRGDIYERHSPGTEVTQLAAPSL